jgi:hypothetical protein
MAPFFYVWRGDADGRTSSELPGLRRPAHGGFCGIFTTKKINNALTMDR